MFHVYTNTPTKNEEKIAWNRGAAGRCVANPEGLKRDSDLQLPAVLFILDKSKDREERRVLGVGSGRCGSDIKEESGIR